ncbi:hypothetical protein KASHIRA_00070 [Serratia phage vB_SmaM-Kashira]|nr:hypothetical protein KASHIRA_00070 [Serratia phage vB_SmaM-Kashira]
MLELKNWVEFTKKYPPAEIFFQQNKEKQEKRCKQLCEILFTLEPTNSEHPAAKLRLMWQWWREFEVLLKLGIDDMKREEVVTTAACFKQTAKDAIRLMEMYYKADQYLWAHYQTGGISIKKMTELVEKEIGRG